MSPSSNPPTNNEAPAPTTNGPSVFTVPTFRTEEEEAARARDIDITTLTQSSIESLRTEDPFMFFSIFKPTEHHTRDTDTASLLAAVQGGGMNGGQASNVVVKRQRRISVESDDISALSRMFEEYANDAEFLASLQNDEDGGGDVTHGNRNGQDEEVQDRDGLEQPQ